MKWNTWSTIKGPNHDLITERLHVKELETERDMLSARTKDCESNEQTMRNRVKDLEDQVVLFKSLVYGRGEKTKTEGNLLLLYKFTRYMTFWALEFPNVINSLNHTRSIHKRPPEEVYSEAIPVRHR